ncbi:MAG: class I adenylate cyclase [Desulfovibrionaceae bacterium]
MSKDSRRYNAIIENLRSMTRGEVQDRLYPGIQRGLDEFVDLKPLGNGVEPWHAAAEVMALHLYASAAATDAAALKRIYLDGLYRIGPFGWVLAAHGYGDGRFPEPVVQESLAALPPETLLGVLDRMQHAAPSLPKEARRKVLARLEGVRDIDPSVGLRFLKKEGNYRPGPAFALAAALHQGATRDACLAGMQGGEGLDTLLAVAETFCHAHTPELSGALAGCLRGCHARQLPLLVDALAATGDASADLAKLVVPGLKHADPTVQLATLEALARLRAPSAAAVFAKVFVALPALRKGLIPLLTLLPGSGFRRFLGQFKAADHIKLLWPLYACIARIDPDGAAHCAVQAAGGDPGARQAQPLMAAIPKVAGLEVAEPKGAAAAPAKAATGQAAVADEEKGKRFGLFGRGGKKEKAGGSMVMFDSPSFSPSADKGKVVRGETFTDRIFNPAMYANAVFQDATFVGCRFEGGQLAGAVFKDCRFERTTFAAAVMSGAKWFRCTLTACVFDACPLDEAVFQESNLNLVEWVCCGLGFARIVASTLASCRFHAVDLSGAGLDRVTLLGCRFSQCLLHGVQFVRVRERGGTVTATSFRDCTSVALDAAHPLLRGLEMRSRVARLRALGGVAPGAGPAPTGEGAALVAEAVSRWFLLGDVQGKYALFMANNLRREEWGMEKLGPQCAAFYRMLPLLLATQDFDRARGLPQGAPSFVPCGYAPSCDAIAAAREYFPDLAWRPDAQHVAIEAIFTIGSLGSVAQGAGSDIDYWVCADLKAMDPAHKAALSAKLEALTAWADEAFGLEAYFFLMDTEAVRRNNFGFSDKESSGSAQALLLKEEFYRSALLVAGRPPVWWFSEAGASQAAYEKTKAELAKAMGADFAIDLGHMAPIPAEEYFGASLWQIVKGLKSPFKSILKFGLLEFYTSGTSHERTLLCDRIKANILARRQALFDVDPYVILYREVADYYRGTGGSANLSLITLSFSLKAGLGETADKALPVRREEKESLDVLRQAVQSDKGASRAFAHNLSFDALMRMGKQVNQFMIKTYLHVRDRQEGAKASITPEDMTRLGRKIATYFTPRENKIERVPILKLKSDFFSELHLLATFPQNVKTWDLQGGMLDPATGRVKLTPLRQGVDLASMLAWVAANHLYHEGMAIKVDRLAHPVVTQDVQALLTALASFFTEKETFDTDIGETLNPERITRAMLICNLCQAKEASRVLDAFVLYASNWGELFFKAVNEVGSLSGDVAGFVSGVAGLPAADDVRLLQFVPPRSRCPVLLG